MGYWQRSLRDVHRGWKGKRALRPLCLVTVIPGWPGQKKGPLLEKASQELGSLCGINFSSSKNKLLQPRVRVLCICAFEAVNSTGIVWGTVTTWITRIHPLTSVQEVLLSPFGRWESWGLPRLNNVPKVMQLRSDTIFFVCLIPGPIISCCFSPPR